MKTGILEVISDDGPTRTSNSIPDHVERMTNIGVGLSY